MRLFTVAAKASRSATAESRPNRTTCCRGVGFVLFTAALLVGAPSSGQVTVGSSPSGNGGFTWGVGTGGGTCRSVVETMRRNWMDVRGVVDPESKSMRPRSRDFYCVSPQYALDALPKAVGGFSGLKCFDLQGKGFCCDARLQQCATK